MTFELQTIAASDWRAWRSVRLAALTESPDAFGSLLHDWVDAPETRWRKRLSIPGAIDLLAVNAVGHEPVGMATGIPDKNQEGRVELISMWVDPAVRGRGVATALIRAIVRWAEHAGATSIGLSVMPNNVSAKLTYERNGFGASPEPGTLLPGGEREIVMFRELNHKSATPDAQ